MEDSSRRNLLKVAAVGSVSAALGLVIRPEKSGAGTVAAAAQGHSHRGVSGPLASATISFGSWETDPPFDRFTVPTPPPPATRNAHTLTPNEVTIQAGGTVNFIIGGFHLVVIYDHGTKPDDIDPNLLTPMSTPPGLIDDPNNRIYRGLDPRANPQDRVEVVTFSKPGTYLVICAVRPHFVNDAMLGYVRVLP
jgi:plastocyanin